MQADTREIRTTEVVLSMTMDEAYRLASLIQVMSPSDTTTSNLVGDLYKALSNGLPDLHATPYYYPTIIVEAPRTAF